MRIIKYTGTSTYNKAFLIPRKKSVYIQNCKKIYTENKVKKYLFLFGFLIHFLD